MAAVFLVAGFQDAKKKLKKNTNTSNTTTLGYGALASFNNAATGTVALEMETGQKKVFQQSGVGKIHFLNWSVVQQYTMIACGNLAF